MTAAAALLDPISVDVFAREYWERVPLLVQNRGADRFAALLTAADVEDLLNRGLGATDLIIVKDGTALGHLEYSRPNRGFTRTLPEDADVSRVFAAYTDAHTILLQEVERFWPPLATLTAALTRELGFAFWANVYVSPPAARGLPAHFDHHDVFVLQVAGAKRWRLYPAPVVLPDERWPAAEVSIDTSGMPSHDVTLAAGDLMYLPRGVVHVAETSDEPSIHITIGQQPVTLHDWLMEASSETRGELRANEGLRRSVPIGALVDRAAETSLEAAYAELGRLAPRDLLAAALDRLSDRVMDATIVTRSHFFESAHRLNHLTVETLVRRPETVLGILRRRGERLVVRHANTTHTFPAVLSPALETALSGRSVRIGELGTLPPAGQIALARHLTLAGLIDVISAS